MGIFTRNKKEKEAQNECCNFSQGGLSFSELFNQYSPLQLSAIFRCTDLIAGSIATLPVKVRVKGENGMDDMEEHPLNLCFSNKSGERMSKYQFMRTMIQSVIIKGNGFAYIYRNTDGSVKDVRLLESGDVNIYWDKVKDELYYTVPAIFRQRRIEPKNMLHLYMYTYDGITGLSLLHFAKRTIDITSATENQSKNFWHQGGLISGILSAKNIVGGKQLEQIRQAWNSTYNSGRGGLVVLPNSLEYQPLQANNSDNQAIESRNYNVMDIARFFGISPTLLGINVGTSYTYEQANLEFLTHTLIHWIAMVENEFNRKLLKPSEVNIEINLDESYLLKADKAATASYYSTMVNQGIMTRNEARRELGLNPVDGGDEILIPFSKIEDNILDAQQDEEDKQLIE